MKIFSLIKALGATVIGLAVFYVGGMAAIELLALAGPVNWAIKTAAFWAGGLLLAVFVAEAMRRIIVLLAMTLDEDAPPAPAADGEESDDRTRPAAKPAAPPPKAPAAKKV
jgi:hypothetical protein